MNTLLDIDVHGRITGLNCHDGILNMLDVRNKNELKLGMRLTDSSERLISFGDISRLYVQNFREGNIIDSFSLWPMESAPKAAIQLALELSECDSFSNIFPVTEKNKFTLLLESSYGANLLAVIETSYNCDEYVNRKITII